METIRVGIVGAGKNTTTMHIPNLQAIAGVEIVSVCNRSRESSQRAAERFGVPTIYDRWQDLVAAPDTDAIVIGTWPYLHCPATLAALAAGKHVLCEARMAMNVQEARAMRDAARTHPQLVAQIVPAPHTLGVDATVQHLLAEQYLGEPLAVSIRDGNRFLDYQAPLHWRQDMDLSGYNVLSLGIWYEVLLRWLGEATRVMAMGKVFVKQRRGDDGMLRAVRVPEHIDVLADLACGAQAHVQISAATGHAGPAEITVFGNQGTLRFTDGKLFGGRRGEPALAELAIPDERRGRWRIEAAFIGAIRGQEPVTLTPFETGVKYMAFTEAVTQSIATGAAVPILL
ncbi:MAG: Gfo/Idh/MocA family oxidoreductase [Roseiflexaceae bacterium]